MSAEFRGFVTALAMVVATLATIGGGFTVSGLWAWLYWVGAALFFSGMFLVILWVLFPETSHRTEQPPTSKTLQLQREILDAITDPEKLAAIAGREGIDPGLWQFYTDVMARAAEFSESGADQVEGLS